jgi:hypothetical protein
MWRKEFLYALNKYADLVFRCADGVDIPASRYACMTALPLLRDVPLDDSDVDADGRVVLHVPRDSAGLTVALGVVHATANVSAFSEADCAAALEAFEYFGAGGGVSTVGGALSHAVLERAWAVVVAAADASAAAAATAAAVERLKPWLQRFLDSDIVRPRCLRKLVELCVGWDAFRRALNDVVIDMPIATALMRMTRYFPPVPMLRFVLGACTRCDQAAVQDLAAVGGVYYHPSEVADAMKIVAGAVPGLEGMLHAWLDGMQTVEHNPRAKGVTSTFVNYHEPCVSLLVDARDAPPDFDVRLAPWVSFETGGAHAAAFVEYDAVVTLSKLDADARRAKRLDARVTGYDRDALVVYERMYTHDAIASRLPVRVSMGRLVHSAGRTQRVDRVRLDLFFGDVPVWTCPY